MPPALTLDSTFGVSACALARLSATIALDRVHIELQFYPERLLEPWRELGLQQHERGREAAAPAAQNSECTSGVSTRISPNTARPVTRDHQQGPYRARHAMRFGPAHGGIADVRRGSRRSGTV